MFDRDLNLLSAAKSVATFFCLYTNTDPGCSISCFSRIGDFSGVVFFLRKSEGLRNSFVVGDFCLFSFELSATV